MQATGNTPPASVPAKSKYLFLDLERNAKYFNLKMVTLPKVFPIITLLNQRVLTSVSELEKIGAVPQNTLENLTRKFWQIFWGEGTDISQQAVVEEACASIGLSTEKIKQILEAAASPKIKELLRATTDEAISKGAFGAPIMIVKRVGVKDELFFGSDRFHILFPMIGLQWNGPQKPVSKL